MKNTYHTLIIGTGCAGYNAADRLYSFGVRDIAILTEGRLCGTSRNTGSDKQTYYKLSLCSDEGDSVRQMAKTLYDGGGVMGEHALCEATYSARCFMHLVELGVPFPVNEYGEYVGYKTDHDPRSRGTSCGPLTSKYMAEALERSVMEKGIQILDSQRVIKILTDAKGVTGVACTDTHTGEISVLGCQNVILCTGGPAGIYTAQPALPSTQAQSFPTWNSGNTALPALHFGGICRVPINRYCPGIFLWIKTVKKLSFYMNGWVMPLWVLFS